MTVDVCFIFGYSNGSPTRLTDELHSKGARDNVALLQWACRARRHYKSTVQPALEAAGIQHTLHVTHSAGHAAEVAVSLDLQHCDALLIMGGDGTVHEALQVIGFRVQAFNPLIRLL